ncbi:TMEM56 [Branchiostoma lanceolatum]|uniref:TMEM56 protein n=1 Tax=Branchiostoma lanceolatum TaxID=7740 RepID=A0A8J9YM14_BRALA|nr:TMEM56 [Branchiostoma lanceolatum]
MGYDSEYIFTAVGSFFLHLAISEWFSYPLLKRMAPAFVTLPANKQVVLRNSVMSIFHACVIGGLAVYMFLFVDGLNPEDLWFQTPIFYHTACTSLGYIIADSLLMVMYAPLREWSMVLHHTISTWSFHNVMVGCAALYFGNTWFLTELLILHTLGHRHSLLYKVNGVAMLVVFFLCRIVTIPIYFGLIPHMKTGEMFKMEFGPIFNLLFLTPVLCMLNIFWFIKICKGAYRVLYCPKTGTE